MKCVLILLFAVVHAHAEPFGRPRTTVLGSRTQLEFNDDTIIRLGANTAFDFRPGTREMTLEKGTMLFSSPKDAGGGIIHAKTVVAILNHGDLQMANIDNAVTVVCITGRVQVRSTRDAGEKTSLRWGQMLAIPAGATELPDMQAIDMKKMVSTSGLLKMGPLPSQADIDRNTRKQRGVPLLGPPGANAEITAAMTTGQIAAREQINQAVAAQQAADQAAAAQQLIASRQQAAQQAARQAQLAQQAAAAQAAQQAQLAQQAAAAQAAQQASVAQGNQGQGNQGQGNQGQGNQGQGNQGQNPATPPGQGNQGNQGNKPPAPPGQNGRPVINPL